MNVKLPEAPINCSKAEECGGEREMCSSPRLSKQQHNAVKHMLQQVQLANRRFERIMSVRVMGSGFIKEPSENSRHHHRSSDDDEGTQGRKNRGPRVHSRGVGKSAVKGQRIRFKKKKLVHNQEKDAESSDYDSCEDCWNYDHETDKSVAVPQNVVMTKPGRITMSSILSGEDPPDRQVSLAHESAENGDWETLQLLIDGGADVEAMDDSEATALQLACEFSDWMPSAQVEGKLEAIKLLISAGANIEGATPLHRASPETPLQRAVQGGNVEAINLLLRSGANTNAGANGARGTSLHTASEKDNVEALKVLVEAGASLDAEDWSGRTALSQAARGGNIESLKFLLDAGASTEGGEKLALFEAAETEELEAAKLLILAGANIAAAVPNAETPLHRAVKKGSFEVVKLLIEAGANTEARDSQSDEATPLYEAASGKLDAVRMLLGAGANLDAKSDTGRTSLHRAANEGELEVVMVLVDAGADVEAEDNATETPSQLAFANCHLEIVDFLHRRGALAGERYREDFFIDRDKLLGRGAFGAVYLAEDLKRQREVAVKVCPATDSEAARSAGLEVESKLLQTLKHRCIVQHILYHFEEELQEHQVFMELQDEGSLAGKLASEGPMREYDINKFFKCLLDGLVYMHANGIIHRDLKPGNALLHHDILHAGPNYETYVKISDVGCSVSFDREIQDQDNRTTTIAGTLPYMAPEVFRGESSEGSDLWALACTVVEMATARRPWHETEKVGHELRRHIVTSNNSHPLIPDHLTCELKDILIRMFHHDPKKRGTASAVASDPYFQDNFTSDLWLQERREEEPSRHREPTGVTAVTSRFVTISSDDD